MTMEEEKWRYGDWSDAAPSPADATSSPADAAPAPVGFRLDDVDEDDVVSYYGRPSAEPLIKYVLLDSGATCMLTTILVRQRDAPGLLEQFHHLHHCECEMTYHCPAMMVRTSYLEFTETTSIGKQRLTRAYRIELLEISEPVCPLRSMVQVGSSGKRLTGIGKVVFRARRYAFGK